MGVKLAWIAAPTGQFGFNSSVTYITNAGVPVDGVGGTGAGSCGPGSFCFNSVNGKLYVQTGTLAAPVWVAQT